MRKVVMLLLAAVLFFSFAGFQSYDAHAATRVMWGKTELKAGQIGKVTVLSNTDLVTLDANGSLKAVRTLKAGEEYRVYSYKSAHDGLYGVGGGQYIQKSSKIKYETPSKAKLALLEQQSSTPQNTVTPAGSTKIMWGKTELKKGQIGKITVLGNTPVYDVNMKLVKTLTKGEEFRVYSYKSANGGMYGIGGGLFVKKDSSIKYETPSKSKLALLDIVNNKPLQVHFINVGQGDSILIQTSNGKSMLVDGGAKSAGDEVVSFLKGKGVTNLDYVVATHPDADHIGGLISVLNTFQVSNFVDSGQAHTTQTYYDLLSLVDAKNINYVIPKAGSTINLDSHLGLTVLNAAEAGDDNNEASIVLRLTYGNISVLLMGDADTATEQEIISRYAVKSTVLKAGHHGSNTSSSETFINAVKPAATVLSYGYENSYGHPHPEVVSRLKSAGSLLYSTVFSGNITMSTNGLTYSFNTKPWNGVTITPTPVPEPPVTTPEQPADPGLGTYVIPGAPTSFSNCTAMREYYPNGVKTGHPAYAAKHDRDNDGWACER
ncbi:MBL fold metallo-hydrolase [Bacillus sp. JJ1532]|uniref:MBL fold metallo-hydrolase n=1 Tax=unclassified Bacillus (in: firmicutes) TaxID=185979 RepID=UPI002FFD8CE6